MYVSLAESDSSTFNNDRRNPMLRYLYEHHLSTRNRIKKVHEFPYTWRHSSLPVSGHGDDGEYEHVVQLSEQVNRITAELLAPIQSIRMQIAFNQEPPVWQTHLKNATTVEDIVLVISHFGRSPIADRLYYLHGLPIDEPYQKPMNLESVKGFALFIMNNAYLPYPDIMVNPDGRVTIEWDVVGHGTLILEFLSSEYVEYLDVLEQSEPVRQRQYSSGVSPIDSAMDAVKPAIDKLMSQ